VYKMERRFEREVVNIGDTRRMNRLVYRTQAILEQMARES